MGEWVAAEIVKLEDVKKRVKAVQFFIDLADECAKIQNFNALFAVVQGGLRSSSVFRMKKTLERIDRKYEAKLDALLELISSDGKYKAYRTLLSQVEAPLVPYLGEPLARCGFVEAYCIQECF
jgi:hypothetical protein